MQGVRDKGETTGKDTSPNLSQGQDPVRPDGDSNAFILGLWAHMHMVMTHWIDLVWCLCIKVYLLYSAYSMLGLSPSEFYLWCNTRLKLMAGAQFYMKSKSWIVVSGNSVAAWGATSSVWE